LAKERQEEIIRAAAKRFSRHGFNKTTLEEIARDVRIGKPTIYHYFKSKDELFFSSISFQSSQFIEDIRAIFNNQDLPVGARLLEYFAFKETVNHRYKLLYDLILALFRDDSLEKERQILQNLLQKETEVVGLILSSIYTGRIESMNPSLPFYIVHLSWGLMFSTIIKEFNSEGKAVSMKEMMFKSLETILS
jgi:AcrR family transcriptional regulator